MGENSKIEWCDHTFNPFVGCTKISSACDFCYAETWAKRCGQPHLWQGERRRTSEANWRQPLKWNRQAEAAGVRARVFCASLADVFDNQVPDEWREDLWALIRQTPHLDWLLLTKRPQNIAKMLPVDWVVGWDNVWLGATVESQEEADRRIPHLLAVPAKVRFLSCEPLLGELDILKFLIEETEPAYRILSRCYGPDGFDETGSQSERTHRPIRPNPLGWVIAGGESGPHARPMHPDWARSLRDQCAMAGVPYFFKQHGEWIGVPDLRRLPGGSGPGFGAYDQCRYDMDHEVVRVGKKAAGHLLDGVEHREVPR